MRDFAFKCCYTDQLMLLESSCLSKENEFYWFEI
jgi:hypothetical protein